MTHSIHSDHTEAQAPDIVFQSIPEPQERPAYVAISLIGNVSIADAFLAGFSAKALTNRADIGLPEAPEGAIELAVIYAGRVTERLLIDEKLWAILLKEGDFEAIRLNVAAGAMLSAALQKSLNIFEGEYEHGACKTAWSSRSACAQNSECAHCGTSVEPIDTIPIRVLEEGADGAWRISEMQGLEPSMQTTLSRPR